MDEKEQKFEIIVEGQSMKFAPFGFGTYFSNMHFILTSKLSESKKNLEEHISACGKIKHINIGVCDFKELTTREDKKTGEIIYQIVLTPRKQIQI